MRRRSCGKAPTLAGLHAIMGAPPGCGAVVCLDARARRISRRARAHHATRGARPNLQAEGGASSVGSPRPTSGWPDSDRFEAHQARRPNPGSELPIERRRPHDAAPLQGGETAGAGAHLGQKDWVVAKHRRHGPQEGLGGLLGLARRGSVSWHPWAAPERSPGLSEQFGVSSRKYIWMLSDVFREHEPQAEKIAKQHAHN